MIASVAPVHMGIVFCLELMECVRHSHYRIVGIF